MQSKIQTKIKSINQQIKISEYIKFNHKNMLSHLVPFMCSLVTGRKRKEPIRNKNKDVYLKTNKQKAKWQLTQCQSQWRWPSPAGRGCQRGSLWAPPGWGGRRAPRRAWGRVCRCCWSAGRRSWPAGWAARRTRSTADAKHQCCAFVFVLNTETCIWISLCKE